MKKKRPNVQDAIIAGCFCALGFVVAGPFGLFVSTLLVLLKG